jgi:hypothetical protein
VSPATRLLEKRRETFEIQEALEKQKQEFAEKVCFNDFNLHFLLTHVFSKSKEIMSCTHFSLNLFHIHCSMCCSGRGIQEAGGKPQKQGLGVAGFNDTFQQVSARQ